MGIEEICALAVVDIAHDDAILWLWTTNAHIREAFAVIDAWGFTHKTILTWAKPKMGIGDWLSGQTEHCIMSVRGKPTVQLIQPDDLAACAGGRTLCEAGRVLRAGRSALSGTALCRTVPAAGTTKLGRTRR